MVRVYQDMSTPLALTMAHMPYPLIPVEPNRGDPVAGYGIRHYRDRTRSYGAISTPPPMTADFTAVYNAAKA